MIDSRFTMVTSAETDPTSSGKLGDRHDQEQFQNCDADGADNHSEGDDSDGSSAENDDAECDSDEGEEYSEGGSLYSDIEVPMDTWVNCHACHKWRMLPPNMPAEEIENLPYEWSCKDNIYDPPHSRCEAEERRAMYMVSHFERRGIIVWDTDESSTSESVSAEPAGSGTTAELAVAKHYTESFTNPEPNPSPSTSQIIYLVDSLFQAAEIDEVNFSNVERDVAVHFGLKSMESELKSIIQARLDDLMVGRVVVGEGLEMYEKNEVDGQDGGDGMAKDEGPGRYKRKKPMMKDYGSPQNARKF